MKIYAPVRNVNGVYASVMFVNGVGETDNPALIKWFKDHGYELEDQTVKSTNDVLDTVLNTVGCEDHPQDEFESMTPLELREWARQHGLSGQIKGIRNREKLLDIIRGE